MQPIIGKLTEPSVFRRGLRDESYNRQTLFFLEHMADGNLETCRVAVVFLCYFGIDLKMVAIALHYLIDFFIFNRLEFCLN